MIWFLPIVLGCSTEPAKTAPDLTGDGGQTGISATDYQGLPVLSVNYPQRGEFDNSGSGVVEGRVLVGDSEVETLTINGEKVDVDADGHFREPVGWRPGIQIIGTRVEASNGERAVDGRAVHAGPVHSPEAWIENAIRIEIDEEILDDDDADPDDIAGLLELALDDPALLESVIGVPMHLPDATFTPLELDYGRTRLDLSPTDGSLDGMIGIDGIEIDFDLDGVSWYSWLSTYGTASAGQVDVGFKLIVESAGGVIRCEATEFDVVIDDLAYDIHYVPDILEGMTSGWAEDFIASAVKDVVQQELMPEVEDILTGFAVGATFDTDLSFDLRLAEIDVVEDGIRFEVDARIGAIDAMALPLNAGSLDTDGVPPEWPTDKVQPFWAAVDDDLLNQLGFAFWHTGVLKDVEFDGAWLNLIQGGPLPEPLGPVETITMSLHLPPVVTESKQDDWAAQMALGEWELGFHREDGEILRFSVNVRSHLQVDVDEDGEIGMAVDSRPAHLEQAVGVLQAPEALDPGDLSALIRLLVPPLLGSAGAIVPDLPVPEVPLDEFLDLPATQDMVVRVADPSLRLEDNGWLLLQADIEVH